MEPLAMEGSGEMSKHDDDKLLICPHCLKRFESRKSVKLHQKAKRHTQFHYVDQPWSKWADTGRTA
jgi:uncharacterized C2H2 Zn-finger protein